MATSRRMGATVLIMSVLCVLWAKELGATGLPPCEFPAVYAFGDSLTDTGNGIAAFPDQFAHAELPPHGVQWPQHAADRFCDGKLLVDFLTFGVRQRPIYPTLRGIAGDFTWGANFAAYGAPARTVKSWRPMTGFNTPFSLNVQAQWFERYKIHNFLYYPTATLNQSMPKYSTINESLHVVWSGHEDYFSSLYYKTLTPSQTLKIVPAVVKAIEIHLENLVTPVSYSPPIGASFNLTTAHTILVVNMPPLGCIPAMLALYGGSYAKYDSYGCLSDLNKITSEHNTLLAQKVDNFRAKHPDVLVLLGDANSVYIDILKNPKDYNVTAPLQACCGVGGAYNFNNKLTCGQAGMFENKFVNLTVKPPCPNPAGHLSWNGIHTSNTFNKAAATAFLTGKHISPQGGLNCNPDFSSYDSPI